MLLRHGGRDLAATVRREGESWLIDGLGQDGPAVVRRDPDGAWVAVTPEGPCRMWVHAGKDVCRVFWAGRVFEFGLPDPEQDVADEEYSSGPRLLADMPGKVVKVLVDIGQAVTAGQPLVIMESMKMETELAAAVPGTVADICAEIGQVVAQGDLLVLIEPLQEGNA